MDFNNMLGKLLNGGAKSGFGAGLAGGLAASLLTSRGGRKIGKSAIKYGGLAALGAIAYHAYNKSKQGASTAAPEVAELAPAPAGAGYGELADAEQSQRLGASMIRAMIAAAHADGQMDAEESKKIFDAFQQAELSAEEKAFLVDEMSRPASLDDIAQASTGPEVAAELYAASLLAVKVDHPAEKAYLDRLADRLGLGPNVVASIHAQIGSGEEA